MLLKFLRNISEFYFWSEGKVCTKSGLRFRAGSPVREKSHAIAEKARGSGLQITLDQGINGHLEEGLS